jgi:hypothetical protein
LKTDKETYYELFEILKDSRILKGDYTFKNVKHNDDFNEEYEELFYSILEVLKDDIGDNYWNWYDRQVNRYCKDKISNNKKNQAVYIPQRRFANVDHTVRQQLTVLKFYVRKKTDSQYN